MANSNRELLEGFFRQYENGADLYSAGDNYANFVNDPSLLDASALTIDLLNLFDSFLSLIKNTPLGSGLAVAGITQQLADIRLKQFNGEGVTAANVLSIVSDISALVSGAST